MAKARTPRQAWIYEGLLVLAESGVDAVRVEVLAKRLGVSKGGFYGYFADRGALLAEMLDTWAAAVTDRVMELSEAGGGTAEEKLHRLAGAVAAPVPPTVGIAMDLAVRHWARADADVARRLFEVDGRKLDYLRSLYREVVLGTRSGKQLTPEELSEEVEFRATTSYAMWLAAHLGILDHSDRSRSEVQRAASARLLR